jgi:hypothetical protein
LACGCCPAPRARKFPWVRPRVSAGARIDRKKCPHRKASCQSRLFWAAHRFRLSATAGPSHGRRSPGFVVTRSICWQQIQTGQRRLVLDVSNTRLVRKNDHPCSPPLRITIHQSWAQLACAPQRYMPWLGGWIEPTRVSRRSAHTRDHLVCDVMKTEPFGKPAVWMYQFW